MAAQQDEFNPQAGFLVTAASTFGNFNGQTFTRFYQPILGPEAFSLFYALRDQLIPQPTLSDRRLQANLIRQMNAGTTQVATALHRLEAVGLVQTYQGKDNQGEYYVYQLQPTLTPTAFIDDDLLSVLLLEAVGDSAFNSLSKWAHRYQLASHLQLTDVSHHFLDEFHVTSQAVLKTPSSIQTARQQTKVEKKSQAQVGVSDFDWPTLYQLIKSQPLVKKDLAAHRELLEVEHQLYGIDEPTMARLVLKAVNLADNHFDAAKFKQVVANQYQQAVQPVTSSNKKEQQAAPAPTDLTAKDKQLLQSVTGYAPVEFLQGLKEQTGGFVSANERHILTHLVKDVKLDTAVINVLTWYVIAELDNATLKANFVDAIANNWLKAGVKDAPGALRQLKVFNQQRTKSRANYPKARSGYRRPKIEEQMPQWSKSTSQDLNKKASPEEVKEIQAMLARRKNKGGE